MSVCLCVFLCICPSLPVAGGNKMQECINFLKYYMDVFNTSIFKSHSWIINFNKYIWTSIGTNKNIIRQYLSSQTPRRWLLKQPWVGKNFLLRKLRAARVQPECEVFNLFARELPQEGLSRIERGRTRQTMLPDFKIAIPEAGARSEPRLFKLKVLSSCPTHYQWNPRTEGWGFQANFFFVKIFSI